MRADHPTTASDPAATDLSRLRVRDRVLGSVPRTFLRVLADHLHACGQAPEPLMGEAWAAAHDDHLAPYPAEAYCALLLRAAEQLQDPLLGLHLGQSVRLSHLGAIGYVMQTCETLGAALLRIQRYHRLLNDINPIDHRIDGDRFELRWGVSHGKPGALFDESGITFLVEIGRRLCDGVYPVEAVDFVNPPPRDAAPFTRYFGCPVRWGQPMTRLVIPLAMLQQPLPKADPLLLQLMEAQVDRQMSALPCEADGELGARTVQVVIHLAREGMPELEDVAQALRLSPRVYYRRLAEAGLNFRELRKAALRQLAEAHLRDGKLPIAEIGALLGYTETSAFSRAFKQWTGVSPLQWRQQCSPQEG